jgi:pimeloyl-ACP methyl ester carboxylesterase
LKSTLLVVSLLLVAALAFWLWTPDKDRRVLEARYLADPGEMVQLGDWRLRVRDSGPRGAPAVILLHGFGASLDTWDAWTEVLAAGHRVVRFDLPGSGLSEPDPAANYTDARSVELLLALMDHLGLARASLVGHSIGGRIAWTFAALHPERVDKLVLVAPDGFASPGFEYGKAPAVPALLQAMRFVLPKAVLRMNLEPAYANPAFLTDAVTTRYHDLMLAPGARAAMLARVKQAVLVDPVPLLKRIQAPTLLIWGERDAMIPFSNSADYLAAVPNITRVAIPGAGHVVQEEAARASVRAAVDFLDEPTRRLDAAPGSMQPRP